VKPQEAILHSLLASAAAVNDAILRVWRCEPMSFGQPFDLEHQLRDRMDACGMNFLDLLVDHSIGDDLAVEDSLGIDHVQASELGTLKQHLPTVEPDRTDLRVLAHEPPTRQGDPHKLALLVALGGSVLRETVCLHGGGGYPVVGDLLVPRAQARLCNESVEELTLVLPIARVHGLGHFEVVSIWRQAVLSLVLLDLLLRTFQEEGPARVLGIELDPLTLQVIKGVEKIALRRPAVRSAEIRNDMHLQAAAPNFSSVV